ncbi:hypothetical protein PROFUN_00041 [Planoprotostelium fungivorum]|uniref:Uncharacterized protein n=1 Tax=Planoprotostelium fungivorum TaxID=1890364 RepID=A0A2P6P0I0_9EUKA|nr:hypothetical protein PROFUN_00041 [Planoprotostelium fungivorum]
MTVTIVGAGAAGLTSAIFAAKNGRKVILLERNKEAGKKILMSGGSRCNVLPVKLDLSKDFFTDSPHLMKRIFSTWNIDDCHRWLTSELGLKLSCEEETSKWFPTSNDAREVRDALVERAKSLGVVFHYNSKVTSLERGAEDQWIITTEAGKRFPTEKVILSSGGLSYPAVGTDGAGHQILKELGHTLIETYPALTPLHGEHPHATALRGVTLPDVKVRVRGEGKEMVSQRTGFLFTHKGFSGPSILDSSHRWIRRANSSDQTTTPLLGEERHPSAEVRVSWTGESAEEWHDYLLSIKTPMLVPNAVRYKIPARLSEAICAELDLLAQPMNTMTSSQRKRLVEHLVNYQLKISGHGGYKLAEVTGGGLPLTSIDTRTMELKSPECKGLHVCGEILDVFGRIGGFNFYWAWLSGRLAGMKANG